MTRRVAPDRASKHPLPTIEETQALGRAFSVSLAWSREQLGCWFPDDTVETLCRRLERLTRRGVLVRVRLGATRGSGQYVYLLSRAGSLLLLGSAVTPRRGEPGRDLHHSLGISRFYLRLREVLGQTGELIQWWGQAAALCYLDGRGGAYVNPDAAFLIGHRWEQLCLFEYDRAPNSAGATQFITKISRYLRFYEQRGYRFQFGLGELRPILLCLFADEQRLLRIRTRCRVFLGQRPTPPTILFGRQEAAQTPLGRVWQPLHHDQQVALFDDALR